MSASASIRLWFLIGSAVAAVLAANAHLLYAAISSQPSCVVHVRPGDGSAAPGIFSAAQSSCPPLKQRDPS